MDKEAKILLKDLMRLLKLYEDDLEYIKIKLGFIKENLEHLGDA